MTRTRMYRRIVRRETHSGRSLAAVLAVLLLILALVWLGTEIALHLLGEAPLLAAPRTMTEALAGSTEVTQTQLVAIGMAALVVGVFALAAAFVPGRRARHSRTSERVAVIIDDAAFASAAAARVATEAQVPRAQVHVSVGRKVVEAVITPVTGLPTNTARGEAALQAEIDEAALRPALRGTLSVREKGVVGA